jgi:hypothetical protein
MFVSHCLVPLLDAAYATRIPASHHVILGALSGPTGRSSYAQQSV